MPLRQPAGTIKSESRPRRLYAAENLQTADPLLTSIYCFGQTGSSSATEKQDEKIIDPSPQSFLASSVFSEMRRKNEENRK